MVVSEEAEGERGSRVGSMVGGEEFDLEDLKEMCLGEWVGDGWDRLLLGEIVFDEAVSLL